MAKPQTRQSRPAIRDHGRRLERLMLLERVRGPAVAMSAVGVALLAWPASVAGLLSTATALRVAFAFLLLAAMHAGFAEFVDEQTSPATAASLVAFAALWAFVAWVPFADQIDPGSPLFAGELHAHEAAVQVPLAAGAGAYRLTVEGRLPGGEHASRAVQYRIEAGDGSSAQTLEGEFSERWNQRRTGRRGVATVHVAHTERAHHVTASGDTLSLSLQSLTPGASDVVGVKLYRDVFPAPLFVGLGAALTAAALVIDAWRPGDASELLLTTLTLGSLLAVASFRRYAPPHPGFGDLAFNGALGAIGGTIGGRIAARVAHLARRQRAAVR